MSELENEKAKWMSIGDAAKYLGLSRDTLRRWEKAGRIMAVRSPTNRRYYTQKILDEALNTKSVAKKIVPSFSAKKKIKLGHGPKLAIIGFISFFLTAAVAFLLLYFLLG